MLRNQHSACLVLIDLSQADESRLRPLSSVLDAQEHERWQRLRLPQRQGQFLAAHLALRHALGQVLNCDAAALRFLLGEFGKPALADQALEFNFSHSGDWALLAIGNEAMGVDIEALIGNPTERLASQVLSADELSHWTSLSELERSPALTQAWTAREALLKADGGGLRWDLQRARLPSALPGWAEIRDQQRPWWLQRLPAPVGLVACLATQEPPKELEFWRFCWDSMRLVVDSVPRSKEGRSD